VVRRVVSKVTGKVLPAPAVPALNRVVPKITVVA
jgi:hypothetical protein